VIESSDINIETAKKENAQTQDADPKNTLEKSALGEDTPSSESQPNDLMIAGLQKRIQELEIQAKDKESKHLYLYADFDNFKKRSIKERSDLLKFGWENVARDLLQTLDNLDRALAHAPAQTDPVLLDGLKMVLNQFKSSLQKQGVEEIETREKLFDPHLHEAIGQEPSLLPAGTITQEFSKGYTLHGRLLRPARVTLSSGAEQKI
jgi:molecular chaperone GrpE